MCKRYDMCDERNCKDGDPKEEKRNSVTNSKAKKICDYRDLKLKDAEKTIANKDIIIKMLQHHQKKIEESLKQNLKETEYFRFKYRIALEQIKRFRGANKMNEKPPEKCLRGKCNRELKPKALKEQPETSSEMCSCAEHLRTIETFMTVHYELVQNLMENKSKESVQNNEDNKKYIEQIANLQKEIDRLKEENSKLHEQAEPPLEEDNLIPKVKDSIIETYKKSNKELLKKVSQLEPPPNKPFSKDDDGAEIISLGKPKKLSPEEVLECNCKTCPKKKSSSKISLNNEPLSKDDGGAEIISVGKVSLQKKLSPELLECNLETCPKKKSSSKMINNEGRHASLGEKVDVIELSNEEPSDVVVDENKTQPGEKVVENVDLEQKTIVASCADINNMSEKLDDIRKRVMEVLSQQSSTNKEIELLKSEMAISRDTTKECTENISKLKITIDEQKQTFEANFQENKVITDSLIQANDKIQQELSELKNQIQTLSENVDEVKNKQNEKSESENVVAAETKTDANDSNMCDCDSNSPEEQVEPEPTTEVVEEDQDTCGCGDIDIQTYIEKVQSENNKLRTTISTIIEELNEKMAEMKECKNVKQDASNCSCREIVEKKEVGKTNTGAQVEIEDIYNSVRNTCLAKKTTLNESSTSCLCKDEPPPPPPQSCCCSSLVLRQNVCNDQNPSPCGNYPLKQNNIEDIYASILCMCRNGSYTSDTTNPSHLQCKYFRSNGSNCLEPEENYDVETVSEMEICVAEPCNHEQCLVSSLENYINYLYEQLKMISCIESRIDILKTQAYPTDKM